MSQSKHLPVLRRPQPVFEVTWWPGPSGKEFIVLEAAMQDAADMRRREFITLLGGTPLAARGLRACNIIV
jgi:hypothetical protein